MKRQKPDGNTQSFRQILADLRARGILDYIEPPSGIGCDYIVYMSSRIIHLEVKQPGSEKRLTKVEKRLQEICEKWGLEFHILSDPEELIMVIYGEWSVG